MGKMGKVVLLEPGKTARIIEMELSLENIQKTVGGLIQVVYPFEDDACLVCNDEGKNLGLALNRAVMDRETDEVMDIIAGTFFICRHGEEDLTGLTDEQAALYFKRFRNPEKFLKRKGGGLIIVEEMFL